MCRLLVRTALLLLLSLFQVMPSASAEPALCKDTPKDFFSERTSFIDKWHRDLVEKAKKAGYEDLARVNLAAAIEKRISSLERRDPYTAAILRVERVYSGLAGDIEWDDRRAVEADARRALTSPHPTAAGSEALAMIEAGEDVETQSADDSAAAKAAQSKSLLARRSRLTKALDDHRHFHGDTPRQFLLWTRLYLTFTDPAEQLDIARKILAASLQMKSPFAVLQARVAVFRHLPDGNPERIALASSIANDAMIMADTPVPIASDEASQSSCYNIAEGFTAEFIDAFNVTKNDNDKIKFLGKAAQHIATGISFGTHELFILQDMSTIMSVLPVDRPAFLGAMSRLQTMDRACSKPNVPAALCGLLGAASNLLRSNQPAIGITLLREATDVVTSTPGTPSDVATRVQIELAEAEWRYGARSSAEQRASAISVDRMNLKTHSSELVALYRMRAEIADARLDPIEAIANFEKLVDAALEVNAASAKALENEEEATEYKLDHYLQIYADELVQSYMLGQFCAACGEALVAPAAKWINAGIHDQIASRVTAARALLYQQHGARRFAELNSSKLFLGAFRASMGAGWKSAAAEIKKRQGKVASDLSAALTLAAIVSVYDVGEASEDYSIETVIHFGDFIFEKDSKKRQEAWLDILRNEFAEDENTDARHNELSRFASDLVLAGHPAAAETIFLDLTSSVGADNDNEENNRTYVRYTKPRAAFWSSAHLSVAREELKRNEWDAANDELGLAQQIITQRIDDDWKASLDRVSSLLRDLRPVLDHLATTRVSMAATAPAEDKEVERAFEALQLAMLGETAASMQASQRRRLLADSKLSQLSQDRDAASAKLDLMTTFDDTVGVIDKGARDREMNFLKHLIAGYEGELAKRLPASESVSSLRPLPLAEAKSLLGLNEAIVMLHVADDGIYGSLITKDGSPTFWTTKISHSELDNLIASLRAGLDIVDHLPMFPVDKAHEAYRILLGPVNEKLAAHQSLIILADGPLNTLPLSVLLREPPSSRPQRAAEYAQANLKWLGHSHALSYLPAARALEARKSARLASKASRSFVGIANPVLADAGAQTRRLDHAEIFSRGVLANVALLREMESLPETEDEVRKIAALLKAPEGDLFFGPDATEERVRSNGLGDYRIVMFATHGAVGGELRGLSEPGVILTPPDEATVSNDGVLTASEVSTLKLDADLVILSACNTASSDGRPRAEGFSGLTRSFLSAGARAVLVTHWSIPSLPAVAITTRMVDEHARNPSLSWSEALRRSFNAMASGVDDPSFGHPSNWAAFVIVGADVGGSSTRH
jgi:CHAT domain-containing protein